MSEYDPGIDKVVVIDIDEDGNIKEPQKPKEGFHAPDKVVQGQLSNGTFVEA